MTGQLDKNAIIYRFILLFQNIFFFKELPLEVKWPNDIYFDRKFKLGGILAKTSLMGDSAFLKIGVGFNLDNEHPTSSLNKALRESKMPMWSSIIVIIRCAHFYVLEFY